MRASLTPGQRRTASAVKCDSQVICRPRHQRAHFVDTARGADAALVEHRDARCQGLGFFEVVRGQYDRAALGEQDCAR
jgi:hypothetical protein